MFYLSTWVIPLVVTFMVALVFKGQAMEAGRRHGEFPSEMGNSFCSHSDSLTPIHAGILRVGHNKAINKVSVR